MNVTEFLTNKGVEFEALPHPDTHDAQRMAQVLHVSGREVAKTVLVRTETDDFVLAVLPANRDLDFKKTAQALGEGVALATEFDVSQVFPDCELGAIPPFGVEYGLRTLVDVSLAEDELIVFEPLSSSDIKAIAYLQVQALNARLVEQDITVRLSDALMAHVSEAGYDPVYGARPLKRAFQRIIENPLANGLLEGRYGPGDEVTGDIENGEVLFKSVAAVSQAS